jgi:type IV pilus assembly protein PilM
MLGLVQNLFAAKANPIGVDFGTDSLRLAQVQRIPAGTSFEYRLFAAASADVPSHVRGNPAARLAFFVETTRDLLSQGNFKGRQAILAMPAASMFIQHLRMAKLDEEETKKALPWEAAGKLPIDPQQALIRHLIAGEVYSDNEPRNEVIVMAAVRELVNQFLAAAAKARLDVIGMNVEPKAIIDCFSHVYRRKMDADQTACYIDIGSVATRAVIARGGQIHFARSIPIGGDHLNRAAASALSIQPEEAKMLRIKLCHLQPNFDEQRQKREMETPAPEQAAPEAPSEENSFALLGSAIAAGSPPVAPSSSATATVVAPAPAALDSRAEAVDQACAPLLAKLVDELQLCRRYYESTFPNKPVDRLVFVGGEARQRTLCQQIAQSMGLAAQVGDPLVRMGRVSDIGIESGIDRRQPQPGWAVAIGLSLGPATAQP